MLPSHRDKDSPRSALPAISCYKKYITTRYLYILPHGILLTQLPVTTENCFWRIKYNTCLQSLCYVTISHIFDSGCICYSQWVRCIDWKCIATQKVGNGLKFENLSRFSRVNYFFYSSFSLHVMRKVDLRKKSSQKKKACFLTFLFNRLSSITTGGKFGAPTTWCKIFCNFLVSFTTVLVFLNM